MAKFDYLLNKLRTKDGGNGVTSVNGQTGDVTLDAAGVGAPSGSGTSTGTNTGDQDLSGLVPKTTTVNGKALNADITLTASDVGAPSGSGTSTGTNTGDQDLSGLVPNNRTITINGNSQTLASDVNFVIAGSGGDVVGPVAATDNALVRFDATTGKLIQNGVVTESDDGDLANVNSVSLDTTPASVPAAVGTLSWNWDEDTLDIRQGSSILQVGQEQQWNVRNNTASIIREGTAVYVTGTFGASGRMTVAPFKADGSIPSRYYLGVMTQDVFSGTDGKATTFGKIRNIDTSAWNDGDVLYCSPTTPGELTNVKPSTPNYVIPTAFVIHAATNGTIAVRVPTLHEADEVNYSNAVSLLTASSVQDAIDELASEKADKTVTVNGQSISSNVTLTAADVGAPSGSGTSTGTNTGDQDLGGLVPKTTTVNGQALSTNVTLTASDVGAPSGSGTSTGTNTGDQDLSGLVPKTTTVNGQALSTNVTLTASDVGAPSGSGTSTGTNTGDETASSIITKIGNGTVINASYMPFKKGQLVGNGSGLRDDTITDNVNYFSFSNDGTNNVNYAAFAPSVKAGAKFGPSLSVTGTLGTISFTGTNYIDNTLSLALSGAGTLFYKVYGNVYFMGFVDAGQTSNYFIGGDAAQMESSAIKISQLLGKTYKGFITNSPGWSNYYLNQCTFVRWTGSTWQISTTTPNGTILAIEMT